MNVDVWHCYFDHEDGDFSHTDFPFSKLNSVDAIIQSVH